MSDFLIQKSRSSIAEQFFQVCPRGVLTGVFHFLRLPLAAGKLKILAEGAEVLFQHKIGTPLAALFRHARVVALAVQAHAQVRATFHADLTATGIAGDCPRLATLMTMSGHLKLRWFAIYYWKNNTRAHRRS